MQFRVIVVTDQQKTNNARPPQRNARRRQDRLQYTAPLASAQFILSLSYIFVSVNVVESITEYFVLRSL